MKKESNNGRTKSNNTRTKGYVPYKGSKSGNKSKRGDRNDNHRSGRNVSDCSIDSSYVTSPVGTNDPAWYAKNPELLVSAARIPFPYKPGMKVNPGRFDSSGISIDASFHMPGVMGINFAYSIGRSTDVNSPASIAAREMYARVRSKFSGALDADAPDIFMYSIAIDMIHAYIAWMKRVYRALTTYSPENRDYPVGVLIAMGLDASVIDDLQANKTKLWGQINTLVNMVNKFTVPKDMPLYDRHRWMNEHVYLDNPVPFAQTYVFNPIGFYTVEITSETGTALVHKPLSAIRTVDQMYTYGLELIEALSNWDDAYTINGYLMRAYESSEWYVAELLGEHEVLEPQYDEPVLSQIHNLKAVGNIDGTSLKITQDPNTNAILHTPHIASTTNSDRYLDTVLDLHVVNPSAIDVVEATRLCAHVVTGENPTTNWIHAATEIPVDFYVLLYAGPTGGWQKHPLNYITEYDVTNDSISVWGQKMNAIMNSSAFNMAPITWLVGKSGTVGECFLHGDLFNLTTLSDEQVDEIDRVCVYSEFNCFVR